MKEQKIVQQYSNRPSLMVKVTNSSNNDLPAYATIGSAGMDVRAYVNGELSIIIPPKGYRMIPTGLRVEIPLGYMINVHARSGLAYHHGIMVTNGVGVIDSDFRGEIGVLLYNGGRDSFLVDNGDRIAQLVLQEVPQLEWVIDELDDTVRGEGGMGSTGIK